MTTQVTISADEACKLLNIHRATLYEKARAGEIPGANTEGFEQLTQT